MVLVVYLGHEIFRPVAVFLLLQITFGLRMTCLNLLK